MKTILLSIFSICTFAIANAQNTGDFRSAASGNWSAAATWEKFDGTAWAAATAAPVLADGAITVITGHTVAMDATMSIDSVFVQTGGTLGVNTGIVVTVPVNTVATLPAAGIKNAGIVNVAGKILNQGLVTLGSGGVYNWNNGGEYEHAQAGGSIPISTWNIGSTCNVTGATGTTAPGNANQSYHNFTWNSPGQTGGLNLAWNGNTVSGLLKLVSAGAAANALRLSNNNANSGSPVVITVNDIEVQANILTTNGSSGAQVYTLNVNGNLTVNGSGVFNVSNGSGGDATINIKGNLTLNSSVTSSYAGGHASKMRKTIFSKAGTQVYTAIGTNTFSTQQQVEVASGAMLDLGTSVLSNSTHTFTVQPNGGITTAHTNGFNGNFTSSTQRLFLSNAGNYGFSGTALQSTGTKLQNDSLGISALVQSPTNGFQMTCNNLIINNTGATADDIITLSKQFVVNGTLTLTDGILLPSTTNTLTIPATATIVGGNAGSYIAKRVMVSTNSTNPITIPLGKDGNYRPITLIPATADATTFEAEYYSTGLANETNITAPVLSVAAGGEYWDIGRTTGTANAVVRLPLSGAIAGGTASNKIGVVHYKAASWQWEGGSADAGTNTSGTLETGVVSSFSPFSIGVIAATALPLNLLSFTASYNGTAAQLQWSTTNEINVQKYVVQKSKDGINFTTIGEVNATNRVATNNYSFTDAETLIGKVYYRLKNIDVNGTFKYSNIVSINTKQGKNVQVYPNPASNVITIAIPKSPIATTIQLINAEGKIVQLVVVPANTIQTSMYIGNIATGNYYIQTNGTYKKSASFIKQ